MRGSDLAGRDAAIVRDVARGEALCAIARRHGLTYERVRQIVRAAQVPPRTRGWKPAGWKPWNAQPERVA